MKAQTEFFKITNKNPSSAVLVQKNHFFLQDPHWKSDVAKSHEIWTFCAKCLLERGTWSHHGSAFQRHHSSITGQDRCPSVPSSTLGCCQMCSTVVARIVHILALNHIQFRTCSLISSSVWSQCTFFLINLAKLANSVSITFFEHRESSLTRTINLIFFLSFNPYFCNNRMLSEHHSWSFCTGPSWVLHGDKCRETSIIFSVVILTLLCCSQKHCFLTQLCFILTFFILKDLMHLKELPFLVIIHVS